MVIKIMGKHPSLKRYLGPPPEFPDQDEPITRAVIAEIVAGEAARMVMERKFTASAGSGLLDAANFYGEHLKLLSKYLARCHEHLVGDRPRSLLAEEPAAEVITLARAEKK